MITIRSLFFIAMLTWTITILNCDFICAGGNKKPVRVHGYIKKDGTYVQPHFRTSPDSKTYNNWSTKGNINPYTGKEGSVTNEDYSYPFPATVPQYTIPVNPYPGGIYIDQRPAKFKLQDGKSSIPVYKMESEGSSTNGYDAQGYLNRLHEKEIIRAKYWKTKGFDFDPYTMSVDEMDQKAKK